MLCIFFAHGAVIRAFHLEHSSVVILHDSMRGSELPFRENVALQFRLLALSAFASAHEGQLWLHALATFVDAWTRFHQVVVLLHLLLSGSSVTFEHALKRSEGALTAEEVREQDLLVDDVASVSGDLCAEESQRGSRKGSANELAAGTRQLECGWQRTLTMR